MKFKPEDLYNSPNRLAQHYKKFNVEKRILLTGHSHQAWPDCALDAQQKSFEDAAKYVDEKWEHAMKQADAVKDGYKKLLNDSECEISLSASTHDLLIKLLSSFPINKGVKIVTTDGEFHSIRRQLDRLAEEGIIIEKVSSSPPQKVIEELINKCDDKTIAVMVSSVFFNSGLILEDLNELAQFCYSKDINLIVDTYHTLNVVPFSVKENNLQNAFIVGGGYKYCQLGEGNCFLRFPKNTNLRPVITGWFSEFSAMSDKKKAGEVLYGEGGDLFAGATYDPVSNYRASRVFNFFDEMQLSPELLREVSQHQINLLIDEFDKLDLDPELIDRDRSVNKNSIAGFLVLTTEFAGEISKKLLLQNVFTDYRGNKLRLGPAPYLSDDQIKEGVQILNSAIKDLKGNK